MPESKSFSGPEQALDQLRASGLKPEIQLKAASYLVQNNHYDHYLEVLRRIAPLESIFSDNVEWLYCMGYAMVTKHRPGEAIRYLTRSIAFIDNHAILYIALTWGFLQTGDYGNAFLVSSAGLQNCPDKAALPSLHHLSKVLFKGHRVVAFAKDGTEFKYALFTSNTQEIEAALHHLSQNFTETDELKMLRKHLGHIESIAEVGCLVGNHSVYFLKYFSPKKMLIFDASTISLEHTKANIELNRDANSPLTVDYFHTAIGREKGSIRFFDNEVPVNRLDDLMTERFEFIKIDVDGMEIEALEGARAYLTVHRPKVMIEVLHELKTAFFSYLESIDYQMIDKVKRKDYSNYLIGPKTNQVM